VQPSVSAQIKSPKKGLTNSTLQPSQTSSIAQIGRSLSVSYTLSSNLGLALDRNGRDLVTGSSRRSEPTTGRLGRHYYVQAANNVRLLIWRSYVRRHRRVASAGGTVLAFVTFGSRKLYIYRMRRQTISAGHRLVFHSSKLRAAFDADG